MNEQIFWAVRRIKISLAYAMHLSWKADGQISTGKKSRLSFPVCLHVIIPITGKDLHG